ncbi:hypothetical protein EV127DRAFT_427723 [Xylaria flabelliformis]|nr:hypothetical protein EV127DRAFT_427723 [Xylaria flabelliformis]
MAPFHQISKLILSISLATRPLIPAIPCFSAVISYSAQPFRSRFCQCGGPSLTVKYHALLRVSLNSPSRRFLRSHPNVSSCRPYLML